MKHSDVLQEHLGEKPQQQTFRVSNVSLQDILRKQLQQGDGEIPTFQKLTLRKRLDLLEDVGPKVAVVRVEGLQPGATAGFDDDSFNWDFDTAIKQIFPEPTWCCRSASSLVLVLILNQLNQTLNVASCTRSASIGSHSTEPLKNYKSSAAGEYSM